MHSNINVVVSGNPKSQTAVYRDMKTYVLLIQPTHFVSAECYYCVTLNSFKLLLYFFFFFENVFFFSISKTNDNRKSI